jgi:hypothetical protein
MAKQYEHMVSATGFGDPKKAQNPDKIMCQFAAYLDKWSEMGWEFVQVLSQKPMKPDDPMSEFYGFYTEVIFRKEKNAGTKRKNGRKKAIV